MDEMEQLAVALLSLVETAGMPDTYWQTDSRVALARAVLGLGEDDRYGPRLRELLSTYEAT